MNLSSNNIKSLPKLKLHHISEDEEENPNNEKLKSSNLME